MAIDTLIAFVGIYDNVEDARSDYQLVHDLHSEAGLIDASKHGKSIVYRLRMSVLEEALMGLAAAVGLDLAGAAAISPKEEQI